MSPSLKEAALRQYVPFLPIWWLLFLAFPCARAQDALLPEPTAQSTNAPELPSVSEKWNFFESETVTPFTLVAAGLD